LEKRTGPERAQLSGAGRPGPHSSGTRGLAGVACESCRASGEVGRICHGIKIKKGVNLPGFFRTFLLIKTHGLAGSVRRGQVCRSLLDGEVHREIPCKCDDCAQDCQRYYEDDKIFQSVGLLRFGHSTIIFVRFTAGKTFTRLKVRGTLPSEGCSLSFVFN